MEATVLIVGDKVDIESQLPDKANPPPGWRRIGSGKSAFLCQVVSGFRKEIKILEEGLHIIELCRDLCVITDIINVTSSSDCVARVSVMGIEISKAKSVVIPGGSSFSVLVSRKPKE